MFVDVVLGKHRLGETTPPKKRVRLYHDGEMNYPHKKFKAEYSEASTYDGGEVCVCMHSVCWGQGCQALDKTIIRRWVS